jgi:hypothetical protein
MAGTQEDCGLSFNLNDLQYQLRVTRQEFMMFFHLFHYNQSALENVNW